MKSVSLIIPFFNELDEIKKILSTIPNWTLLPNEILIINTAFDPEPTNIKNYESKIYYLNKSNDSSNFIYISLIKLPFT